MTAGRLCPECGDLYTGDGCLNDDCRPSASWPAEGTVTLVAGPPCAGKNTYIAERAQRGDLIIDSDTLYRALSGINSRDRPENLRPFVWSAYWAVVAETRRISVGANVWVILAAANRRRRQEFRRMNDAHVVVLETPAELCRERALARYGGSVNDPTYADTLRWIDLWWAGYEVDHADERIT